MWGERLCGQMHLFSELTHEKCVIYMRDTLSHWRGYVVAEMCGNVVAEMCMCDVRRFLT